MSTYTTQLPSNLTLESFKSWLLTKDKHEIIGDRRDSCKCPLANWINSSDDYDRKVSVCVANIYISPHYSMKTDKWMKIFINYTDVPSSPCCNVEEALFTLSKIENL